MSALREAIRRLAAPNLAMPDPHLTPACEKLARRLTGHPATRSAPPEAWDDFLRRIGVIGEDA